MLLVSKATLQQHREVTAVVITYGVFVACVLMLAWVIA